MPKVSYERAREILAELLIKENVIDEYFENIEKETNSNYSLVDKEKYEAGEMLINDEFDWSGTSQGYIFWSRISMNLMTIVNKEAQEGGKAIDPFVEVKHPPKASCGLPHIEIGSNTWAFQQIVNGKKVKHADNDEGEYYHYDNGKNHLLDENDDEVDFYQLADYFEGWSIYEEPKDVAVEIPF